MTNCVSGLLSLYAGDETRLLPLVLESLVAQSRPLDELVVVFDGPITTDQVRVLDDFRRRMNIRTLELPENIGLGAALAAGVVACGSPYVARVDSDDISNPERIELQADFLDANPSIAVVGGWVTEFEGDPDNIVATRRLPCHPDELHRFSKRRSPLNHPAVMFRKDAVIDVGNYAPYRQSQDYHLWVRLLLSDYKLANLPQVLVNMSAGMRLGGKRGGVTRLRTEIDIQREFHRLGFTTSAEFFTNVAARAFLRLAPPAFRRAVYRVAWR